MHSMNYHHLYYFWCVAKEMSVTKAARQLRLSQSALSEQIKKLETALGHHLFIRKKQRLFFTESGKLAFDYAEKIFLTGEEMLGVFSGRIDGLRTVLIKIGAWGPLSKNLQYEFIKPLLHRSDVKIVITASSLPLLLKSLSEHRLDIVLSGYPVRSEGEESFHNDFLGEVDVFLVGTKRHKKIIEKKPFPFYLEGLDLFLPTKESRIRSEFDTILDRNGIVPKIKAEVEDMALLRVLALSGEALALVPGIVVGQEIKEKRLIPYTKIPRLTERFYAISTKRTFAHPLVEGLIKDFSLQLKKVLSKF